MSFSRYKRGNTMSDKIDLNKEDFSFVCPLKQSEMTEVDGGFFCDKCEEKVHDVSRMTEGEYKKLITKTENICVSFKKVATMSLLLSVAACASPEESKRILLGKIKPNSTSHIDNNKSIDLFENVDDKNKTIRIEYPQRVELGGKPIAMKKKEK